MKLAKNKGNIKTVLIIISIVSFVIICAFSIESVGRKVSQNTTIIYPRAGVECIKVETNDGLAIDCWKNGDLPNISTHLPIDSYYRE